MVFAKDLDGFLGTRLSIGDKLGETLGPIWHS